MANNGTHLLTLGPSSFETSSKKLQVSECNFQSRGSLECDTWGSSLVPSGNMDSI